MQLLKVEKCPRLAMDESWFEPHELTADALLPFLSLVPIHDLLARAYMAVTSDRRYEAGVWANYNGEDEDTAGPDGNFPYDSTSGWDDDVDEIIESVARHVWARRRNLVPLRLNPYTQAVYVDPVVREGFERLHREDWEVERGLFKSFLAEYQTVAALYSPSPAQLGAIEEYDDNDPEFPNRRAFERSNAGVTKSYAPASLTPLGGGWYLAEQVLWEGLRLDIDDNRFKVEVIPVNLGPWWKDQGARFRTTLIPFVPKK